MRLLALMLCTQLAACCWFCRKPPRILVTPAAACLEKLPPVRAKIVRSKCPPGLVVCLDGDNAWTLNDILANERVWIAKAWTRCGKEQPDEKAPSNDTAGGSPPVGDADPR